MARHVDSRCGENIQECKELLVSADVRLHPANERVGWPHRVDANAGERLQHFFRAVAERVSNYMRKAKIQPLVVGCGNDVWSKFQSKLAGQNIDDAGRFHLKRLDGPQSAVLAKAASARFRMKVEEYGKFWQLILKDSSGSAVGLESVLRYLVERRIRSLYLGDVFNTEVLECFQCGGVQTIENTTCRTCNSDGPHRSSADEALLRKALHDGIEVLVPARPEMNEKKTVAALLHF